MKRTQIYLDDTIFNYLKEESKLEHKSISEIIRDSIYERMKHSKKDLLNGLDAAFGAWGNRDFDTDEYIRDLRRDRPI